MSKHSTQIRRVLIGFAGWAVLLVGIIMIPYPGPGWAVVFVGLSILAAEFEQAAKVHQYAHGKYNLWQEWYIQQPVYIKAIFWGLTCVTTIVTVWLLNGYGVVDDWLRLGMSWAHSPLWLYR